MTLQLPPLSLYIHIPWCVRKCPYCDFNSHESQTDLPIEDYIRALGQDLTNDARLAQGREISTVFFGGGTPSLFPGKAIGKILRAVDSIVGLAKDAEITLEANPGTTECLSFEDLFQAGVNRLSIGVQSFNNQHLKRLGRIHDHQQVDEAYAKAKKAGFNNINVDLMHGLAEQTIDEALDDLHRAVNLEPKHISWYQLTIEPNTAFYRDPPVLPLEDTLADIQDEGQSLLQQHGFVQYEVSAYAQRCIDTLRSSDDMVQQGKSFTEGLQIDEPIYHAKHNANYWRFGDYIGIGAGAHSKITELTGNYAGQIVRRQKTRQPKDYLNPDKIFISKTSAIAKDNIAFEFMMNALRLTHGVETLLFNERTGLLLERVQPILKGLRDDGLLTETSKKLALTPLGQRFLNSVLERLM